MLIGIWMSNKHFSITKLRSVEILVGWGQRNSKYEVFFMICELQTL